MKHAANSKCLLAKIGVDTAENGPSEILKSSRSTTGSGPCLKIYQIIKLEDHMPNENPPTVHASLILLYELKATETRVANDSKR